MYQHSYFYAAKLQIQYHHFTPDEKLVRLISVNRRLKILISCGEPSGEMYAIHLAAELKVYFPNAELYGIGTAELQKAGVKLVACSNELAIIGVLGIFTHLPALLKIYHKVHHFIKTERPDLLITIDYPGFNLDLAKFAKRYGIKTLYYISPKIWAWRQSRIRAIKRSVDLMAVIFPFEVEFYRQFNMPVTYVGNPLLKILKKVPDKLTAKKKLGFGSEAELVALFPGSRSSEIKHLLPIMLKAAELLYHEFPTLRFVLPVARSLRPELFASVIPRFLPLKLLTADENYLAAKAATAAIAASGTATLEIALLETPLILAYKLHALEFWIAKHLVKIPYVGLGNILAQRKIIPELLQHDATPEKIATEIRRLLIDKNYHAQKITELVALKSSLTDFPSTELITLIQQLIYLN